MGLKELLQPPQSGDQGNKDSIKDQMMTLSDVIAPSAVSINPRGINVSGVTARVYYAVSYPRYLNDGWIEPVLNMAKELDVSIFIHPVDTVDTLKKFQKKVAEVQSQINIKADKGKCATHNSKLPTATWRNLETNCNKRKRSFLMLVFILQSTARMTPRSTKRKMKCGVF